MVPQDAFFENLTTPTHPSPLPPEVLFEETEWLDDGTTTREKVLISNFFQFLLWTARNYFFQTTVTPKKHNIVKKVAQYTKKGKI